MKRANKLKLGIAAAAVALSAQSASAALIEAELPDNAYITIDGLDWAWAFPLPGDSSGFDLSFQSAFGWRLPTMEELLSAPTALAFLFTGGNVPFNGTDADSGATFQATNTDYTGDGACATPYFSNTYSHCDWQDGLGQPLGPWAGMTGAYSLAEQLVVRDADSSAVPLPGAVFLLGGALMGLGAAKRRRGKSNA